MKLRSLGVVAVVAVPAAVSATHGPAVQGAGAQGPAVLGFAAGIRTEAASATLLRRRTRTAGCTLGVLPDRRCSPGAIEGARTAAVLCRDAFHTGTVRNVPDSEKHAVEVEYGLQAKPYGSKLEIDHIVSLELGGSNDIANLYPELAPGFHEKDKLENRLHRLVCDGTLTLRTAQRRIAVDWQALYRAVFDAPPR